MAVEVKYRNRTLPSMKIQVRMWIGLPDFGHAAKIAGKLPEN